MNSLMETASRVCETLKILSNPVRLMVLCLLCEKEHNVTELLGRIDIGQTALSQHLTRMKEEGLIEARRDHRNLYYSIKDPDVARIIECLHDLYCS